MLKNLINAADEKLYENYAIREVLEELANNAFNLGRQAALEIDCADLLNVIKTIASFEHDLNDRQADIWHLTKTTLNWFNKKMSMNNFKYKCDFCGYVEHKDCMLTCSNCGRRACRECAKKQWSDDAVTCADCVGDSGNED